MKRRSALNDLENDIRDHLDRETQENIERGMTPDAARLAALRKFGNVTRAMEETRGVWQRQWMEQFLQDMRYALRFLRRSPRFTVAVVLTLALGIGMNTAVFSVVNTVLLKPLPYPNPERLVWVADYDANLHHDVGWGPDYLEVRQHPTWYSAIAAYGYQQAAIAADAGAIQVTGVHLDGAFWSIAGARAALGRLCKNAEQNCLVLSWSLFQRQFGGNPARIGKPVLMNGRPVQLAGVLPPQFHFQFPMWWTDAHPEPVEAYWSMPPLDRRMRMGAQVVAVLKPATGVDRAQAEVQSLVKHLHEQGGQNPQVTHIRVEPIEKTLNSGGRRALLLLLAAGVFVLLIACVNIANLLLARATVRQREVAIRAAVGAGRMRVIRQLLVESVLQALAGGCAGLLLAHWSIVLLIRISPYALPRLTETVIDARVLAFTFAIAVLTGILFGAGPAVSLWRTNLHEALKSGGRSSVGLSGLRLRRMLVAVELALAIVLLTGAGLMVKSFTRMLAHPVGFDPESVITMKLRLMGPKYSTKPPQDAYMAELLRRVEGTPGVQSAGISNSFLWSGTPAFPADTDPATTHVIRLNASSPGYLKALGVTLVKGRWLTDTETGVGVLNESMAREAFGSADPIGRRISVPEPTTIVGVVADVKYSKLDAAAPSEVYVPYRQSPMLFGADIAVRTSGNPAAMMPLLRQRIAEIDPLQPTYDVKTLDQALSDSIAPRRFNLFLFGAFAASALLLSLVGIYGVIAYSVAERTREIGLRMALGARRAQVAGMVVREALAIAMVGILAGLAAAWGLSHLMASLLYDVKANDPAVFVAVAILLGVTALAACIAPALRAASIDPTVSLRYE